MGPSLPLPPACSGASDPRLPHSSFALLVAEFLLYQAKANITVLDVNKNTALHLACSKVGTAGTSTFPLRGASAGAEAQELLHQLRAAQAVAHPEDPLVGAGARDEHARAVQGMEEAPFGFLSPAKGVAGGEGWVSGPFLYPEHPRCSGAAPRQPQCSCSCSMSSPVSFAGP